MASDEFKVDTDGLKKQMPYVRELAAHLDSVGSELQARLAALGQPWGNDETGHRFLESYQGPHRQLMDSVSQSGEVLNSTADGIETMSKNYERQEELNLELLDPLKPGSGDPSTETPHTSTGGGDDHPSSGNPSRRP